MEFLREASTKRNQKLKKFLNAEASSSETAAADSIGNRNPHLRPDIVGLTIKGLPPTAIRLDIEDSDTDEDDEVSASAGSPQSIQSIDSKAYPVSASDTTGRQWNCDSSETANPDIRSDIVVLTNDTSPPTAIRLDIEDSDDVDDADVPGFPDFPQPTQSINANSRIVSACRPASQNWDGWEKVAEASAGQTLNDFVELGPSTGPTPENQHNDPAWWYASNEMNGATDGFYTFLNEQQEPYQTPTTEDSKSNPLVQR